MTKKKKSNIKQYPETKNTLLITFRIPKKYLKLIGKKKGARSQFILDALEKRHGYSQSNEIECKFKKKPEECNLSKCIILKRLRIKIEAIFKEYDLHQNRLTDFETASDMKSYIIGKIRRLFEKDAIKKPTIPCDFCLCLKTGNCKNPEGYCNLFWCNLPEANCGFNLEKEDCYGFDKCPNVKQFYAERNN